MALLIRCVAFFVTVSSTSAFVSNALNFTVLGDFGGISFFPYQSPFEHAVATQMGIFVRDHGSQFILALGDNFYWKGVKDVDDPRFEQTFESVFKNPSLQIPWYVLAGNHDHYGNVSAQIAYTKKSKRWNFPELYYSLSMPIPGSTSFVDIIMIDTVTLCGNTKSDASSEPPSEPDDVQLAEDQWAWLESKLQSSKGLYLVVAGHFPVWSISEHGPTKCLVDRLMPMLHKYNATAYLNGHDHNLQHLEYSMLNTTVDYYVIGAADVVDPSTKHINDVPTGSLKYHGANILTLGGFAFVQADMKSMNLTFVDAEGALLYSHAMLPRV
ncbi:tartrate-resistant acid phosphatase type 5-like [Liolophura sinensis]|uniref:tartrate-resistant acid phosphatase type 5-like n=1 Tax=Liolophura sinensis TaxID=3198878 RepID=UPI003158CCAC